MTETKSWAQTQADPQQPFSEARALQDQAAQQGFDWPDLGPVWDKLDEEIQEIREAVASGDMHEVQDELGDLFFMLINLSRHLGLSPQQALHACNEKFVRRLRYVESELHKQGKTMRQASLDEMEALWQQAKSAK